jgi:hypothetical protein
MVWIDGIGGLVAARPAWRNRYPSGSSIKKIGCCAAASQWDRSSRKFVDLRRGPSSAATAVKAERPLRLNKSLPKAIGQPLQAAKQG